MKALGICTALALSCAASSVGACRNFRQCGAGRRAQRYLRHFPGHQRHGFGGSRPHGGGRFQRRRQEHQGRDRLCRSPEQGRRRIRDRAQMARGRQGRRHRRRAEFGRRPHHQFAAARFQDDVPGIVDGQFRSHRQGLLAEHHSMGQRRLGDRQHHGGGDDGARRQGMVFPHGELRARPGHRGRGHQLHREARRQGAGLQQASARHARTSPRSCCRRRIPKPR